MRVKISAAVSLVALGLSVAFSPLHADSFPEKPLTIVVPWPAGGAYDLTARLISKYAEGELSQPIVVNNISGAAGSTGVRHVVESNADGYTIGVMGTHAIAQSYMNVNAPALENIEPLVFIGPEPASLAVSKDSGIEDIRGYIEVLRDSPGSILNGNDAPGGFSYIAAAMLESQFDVEVTKISYRGYAPTASALLSGEVMSATLPIPLLAEQHRANQVKIIGVAAEERHPFAPDVPTFKEEGFDFIAEDFFMLYVPKGVPEEHHAFLEEFFYGLLSNPDFQKAASEMGLVISPMPYVDTAEYFEQRSDEVYYLLNNAGLVEDELLRN